METTGVANNGAFIREMEQMHQTQMANQIALMKVKSRHDQENEAVQAVKAVLDRGSRNREEMAKSLNGR